MKYQNAQYYLGIDGGGTKTEFLLTDKNCNEIRRLFLGCSNPVNIGIENTFSLLSSGIREICCSYDKEKISVFAGIAGAKTGENEKLITEFLSSQGFVYASCKSDVELALEMCLDGEDGTAVIMGTGIVAFSRNGEKLYRTGGRGYMIDKGGSGFHLGSDALNCAFEFLDGRGGSELILKLTEKKLGCSLEDGAAIIYKGGPSFIASFSSVVFDALLMEDCAAVSIIDRNMKEAARVINCAVRISGCNEKKVVCCGGLCKQEKILYPFLKKYLSDDIKLYFCTEPMVNAAVALAKKLTENDYA